MSETLTQFLARYLISQSTKPTDDNCTYWGPCDLCTYSLSLWDDWVNKTIHNGILNWRYEWDTLMDKLDSDEFNGFWTMVGNTDGKNLYLINDYKFFSQYKCSNFYNSGSPSNTFPGYDTNGNPVGDNPSTQSKVYQKSSRFNKVDNTYHANKAGYRNTIFTDMLEFGRDMFCTNRSFYTMSTGQNDATKTPMDTMLDKEPSAYRSFKSTDQYKKLKAQTGVWNDDMAKTKDADTTQMNLFSNSLAEIITAGDNYYVQNPIPSPYALTKSLLEALMGYDWSDARNGRSRPQKYIGKCVNIGACSKSSTTKWYPGITGQCAKKGVLTGVVKLIFDSL